MEKHGVTSKNKKPVSPIEQTDVERVISVASHLFAKNGYDGVGVRQIAKESGVSMSSIFYHFGSKVSLYEEILDYKYNAFYETLLQAIEPIHDPKQKLECVIGTSFDYLLSDQTFLTFMQRDIVDVITHKYRPTFLNTYSKYFSLSCSLLQTTLDRPIERQVTLSLISALVGYTEMAAMLRVNQPSDDKTEGWYEDQRKALIAVGKSICGI